MVCPATERGAQESLFMEIHEWLRSSGAGLTSLEKLVSQYRVYAHAGVYSDDACFYPYIRRVFRVRLVKAAVDAFKVSMDFFQAAARRDVFQCAL